MKAAVVLSFLATAALAEPPPPLSDADFPSISSAEVELGQALFWDKELSGNRNIACATCHHPRFGSADGLSLGIGEGGNGIGTDRKPDPDNYPEQRIPRNAPALWNAGALGFTVMFADGRIEKDPSRPSGFRTPMEDEMVSGFASLLSAQTMVPVLSNDEMAGHNGESDISKLVRQGRITGPDGAWEAIAKRISAIPAYQDAFDVNNVEQYATNVLGMTKPDESQISTVKSTANDKAVVVNSENDDKNNTESMVTFLASLVAYFK